MASPDKKAFLLRIDPALWAELERLAQSELRSVNGQIEYLLRDALERRGVRHASMKGAKKVRITEQVVTQSERPEVHLAGQKKSA
jgi:hypothetical protein